MKKIIVPIDFSEQSEFALEAAAQLADKHGAEIFALHMLELSDTLTNTDDAVQQQQAVLFLKAAEKRFHSFLDKPYLNGIKLTPIVKHFKVFDEINEVAQKHKVDLVVMGSHGADGLNEIFYGSNAEKVVRNSEIPVLVIKSRIQHLKIENLVFACDFEEESLSAFSKARDFADSLSAKLDLVYINTPGNDFLSTKDAYERITQFLAKANVGLEVQIYSDYSVEKGILNYSAENSADAIAISTHGRKGLSHFFMGSIGEDVANHSKLPVVTFKM